MQRHDYRDAFFVTRMKDRGAQQGNRIVQMYDVWPRITQTPTQILKSAMAPNDLGREDHLLVYRPTFDVLAETLEPLNSVPALAKSGTLVIDDDVLTAR